MRQKVSDTMNEWEGERGVREAGSEGGNNLNEREGGEE